MWRTISVREVPRIDRQDRLAHVFLLEHDAPAFLRAHSNAAANRLLRRCVSGDGISLHKDTRGKPQVPGSGVHLSLSHSGRCLVVAVGPVDLGVDIEYLRYPDKWPALLRWIAAPGERAEAATGTDFLRVWTAKESLVKALGSGLDYGLHRLPVPVLDSPAYRRVRVGDGAYWLRPLPAWKDMVACLALERPCAVQTFFVTDLLRSLAPVSSSTPPFER